MVVVLDCGIGNITSVAKMINKAGGKALISNRREDIEIANAIIFPGVGAFDNGISKLKALESFELISQQVLQRNVPFLGICLGMQLLFESSEEGQLSGLGWIKGTVKRFSFNAHIDKALKVPHMGWNLVNAGDASDLLKSDEEQRFYFVHTFHASSVDDEFVMGTTVYGYNFVSAVSKNNIYGVQFHPEKSHRFGLAFFKNFLKLVNQNPQSI